LITAFKGRIEYGYGQTADIAVVGPEEMEEKEKELLVKSKRLAARLPLEFDGKFGG
jgi:hypothetical protein